MLPADFNWAYPPDQHHTCEASTFIVAQCPEGTCQLGVNQQPLVQLPAVVMSQKIPLVIGANVLTLRWNQQVLRRTVYRCEPVQPPITGLSLLQPSTAMGMIAGEAMPVAVLAPKDTVQVQARLVSSADTTQGPWQVLLQAQQLDTRTTVFAEPMQKTPMLPAQQYFSGQLHLVDAPGAYRLQFQTQDKAGKTTEVLAAPEVTILPQPQVAVLTAESSVIARSAPEDGSRLMLDVPPRLPVLVRGWRQGWSLLDDFSGNALAWVPSSALQIMPTATASLPAVLSAVIGQQNAQNSTWRLPLTTPVLSQAQVIDAKNLLLTLYNTKTVGDFVVYPPNSQVSVMFRSQQAKTAQVVFQSETPLWGYELQTRPDGVQLVLRHAPKRWNDTVILLDPGHGGAETGTTFPNGMPEKDLNLQVAMALQAQLQAMGFTHVALTRTQDVAVSLAQRADMSQQQQADVVLSIHHNALPDGRDPLQYQGREVYYYHPWSMPLAKAFVGSTGRLMLNNLALTRIHTGLAVLLELGYATHPADAARLQSVGYAQREATVLAQQLKIFLQKDF